MLNFKVFAIQCSKLSEIFNKTMKNISVLWSIKRRRIVNILLLLTCWIQNHFAQNVFGARSEGTFFYHNCHSSFNNIAIYLIDKKLFSTIPAGTHDV